MTHAERAALRVFGLRELPKSETELKKLYMKYAKRAHPDVVEYKKDAVLSKQYTDAFKRLQKAHNILLKAIVVRDTPKVYVRFGDGDVRQAKVMCNHLYHQNLFDPTEIDKCKYVATIKWFFGLTICVEDSLYREILEPMEFVVGDVYIRCV